MTSAGHRVHEAWLVQPLSHEPDGPSPEPLPWTLYRDAHEVRHNDLVWAVVKYTENVQESARELEKINDKIFPGLVEIDKKDWRDLIPRPGAASLSCHSIPTETLVSSAWDTETVGWS